MALASRHSDILSLKDKSGQALLESCRDPSPSVLSVASSDDDVADSLISTSPSPLEEGRCPCCKNSISREQLQEVKKYRFNFRRQLELCKEHKRAAAARELNERGIKPVDWDNLYSRLDLYRSRLTVMLINPERSHFYSELVELIGPRPQSSTVHNLTWERLDHLTPGYYGRRGADLLMEHFALSLSKELREFARVNAVAKKLGWAAFVQHVMVLEAATLLIMGDFPGCNEAEARQMLRETAELGAKAHPGDS